MALLFVESFDVCTAGGDYLAGRWTSGTLGATAGAGRNGTAGLRYGGAANGTKLLPGGGKGTLFAGFALRTPLSGAAFWQFKNGLTVQLEFRIETDGRIGVYRSGSTLLEKTLNSVLTANTYAHIQLKAVFHLTTGGSFEVKVNNQTVAWGTANGGATGRQTATTVATADTITVTAPAGTVDYDDLWVCDTAGSVNNDYLGDVRIQAISPSAAGAHTDWTANGAASNFQCVDEAAPNSDTDYVSASTAANIDTYAYSDLTPTTGTVLAVQTNLYARKDDAGTRQIAPVIRSGPTPSDSVGATVSVGDTYQYYQEIFPTNPANSNSAWSISDANSGVNGSEFGVKLIA